MTLINVLLMVFDVMPNIFDTSISYDIERFFQKTDINIKIICKFFAIIRRDIIILFTSILYIKYDKI